MYGRFVVAIVLTALVVVLTSCTDAGGTSRTAPAVSPTNEAGGIPVSAATRQADMEFRVVPDGYADCGSTNLASGWPTTTAFFAEDGAACILGAAASGEPSQRAFYGRDTRGGIQGSIYRVQGLGDISMIEYYVDPSGSITSREEACTSLEASFAGPPSCKPSS